MHERGHAAGSERKPLQGGRGVAREWVCADNQQPRGAGVVEVAAAQRAEIARRRTARTSRTATLKTKKPRGNSALPLKYKAASSTVEVAKQAATTALVPVRSRKSSSTLVTL